MKGANDGEDEEEGEEMEEHGGSVIDRLDPFIELCTEPLSYSASAVGLEATIDLRNTST